MKLNKELIMSEDEIDISDICTIEERRILENFNLGKILQVTDFDDTIYSRRIPLEKEGIKNNRGIDGYYYIIAHYSGIIESDYNSAVTDEIREKVDKLSNEIRLQAIKNYVKEFYGENNGEDILGPVGNIDDLIVKTEDITNVIITAGIHELQEYKVQFAGMSKVPKVIVDEGKDKIKALIKYIINELGYIPGEIIINEDRPEFFIKYGKMLAEELGIQITVNTIKINENNNIAETNTSNIYYPSIRVA